VISRLGGCRKIHYFHAFFVLKRTQSMPTHNFNSKCKIQELTVPSLLFSCWADEWSVRVDGIRQASAIFLSNQRLLSHSPTVPHPHFLHGPRLRLLVTSGRLFPTPIGLLFHLKLSNPASRTKFSRAGAQISHLQVFVTSRLK
jgi:hypothetical protein